MLDREDQTHISEIGTETEEDTSTPSREQIQQAYVTGSDWTTETIISQLRRGNIDLNPTFQRREVWTQEKMCRLIESIILNLPIPQIVLAERQHKPNTFIVLDGKQRLLTIRQFCVDPQYPSDRKFDTLVLKNLPILTDLDGESYATLKANPDHSDTVNAFDNHTI